MILPDYDSEDEDFDADQLLDALVELPEPGEIIGDPATWPGWVDEAVWECGADHLPETAPTDRLVEQISSLLAARSDGRIHLPLAVAEALEKLRDRIVLRRRMADWLVHPQPQHPRSTPWE